MPAYSILNSRNNLVATINVGTTTGVTFPIVLRGQGIAPYGEQQATLDYHLLENFANTTEPTNPVEGMNFYNTTLQLPHFFNGTKFVPYLTGPTSQGGLFQMLPAATGIDFEALATTAIFTAPGDGSTWHPTSILLVPTSVGGGLTVFPQFNLQVVAADDVLSTSLLSNPSTDTHANYPIDGTTRYATGVESISLEVVLVTDDTLLVDAFIFGFNRVP